MNVAEAERSITEMALNSGRNIGDETLLVRFYNWSKENKARSAEEGRPIFEDTDYVEIMQPGNKDSIIRRPATDRDKQRFAEHYRRYKAREAEQSVEGTPLEEWPAITRSQADELRFLNVRTVEQLAGMADSNAQGVMGIHALKEKAKKFLETAESSATAEKLADLEAKYQALLAEREETPRRRGRKPRSEAPDEA